jgi:hypothetical protein
MHGCGGDGFGSSFHGVSVRVPASKEWNQPRAACGRLRGHRAALVILTCANFFTNPIDAKAHLLSTSVVP